MSVSPSIKRACWMQQNLPTTSLAQVFLELELDTSVEVLDVACGTGVVGETIRMAGYNNVDGLDPCQGYLEGAQAKGIYRSVFREFIDPDSPTSLPDSSYDVLLCCAGFFQGLISPRAFPELLRITRPGGIIAWNIAEGYEDYDKDFANYDDIVTGLVRAGRWEHKVAARRHENLQFTDCGSAYLKGFKTQGGISCEGFTFVMKKIC